MANILKGYPEFVPYAFDVAIHIEKKGDKEIANKIRRVAASIIQTSSSLNHQHLKFLTPPLTGEYPVGIRSFFLEDTNRNEQDLGHSLDRTRQLEIEVY